MFWFGFVSNFIGGDAYVFFFCPAMLAQPGFDHVPFHLEHLHKHFSSFAKMDAEWPDLLEGLWCRPAGHEWENWSESTTESTLLLGGVHRMA